MATQPNTTAPAFTNILGITTLPEAPILASTGSFTISDVDMPNDSVSVDIPNVSVESLGSANAVELAAALNVNAPNFLTLSLEPNTTFSAETAIDWSFNIANIPAFESLLTGEDIKFSYQIDATDSNDLVTTQILDFTIQGKTQILDVKSISGVLEDSVNAIAQQRATIIVQTENGTQIRLFDAAAGLDVTDKFNLRYNAATDLNAGIKTLTFELKDSVSYNGTKSLTAKSFLDSDTNAVQSTFPVPIFIIPSSNGDDTITGSAGADTLSGGLGNDTYIINDAANVILEGVNEGSSDTVRSTISYTLPDNVEDLYLDGTAATGIGNSGSNKIFGNDAINTLDDGDAVGSTITNTLSGGKGGDIYIIHSSATMVMGETNIGGIDTVQSFVNFTLPKNVENLTLMGTLNSSGKGNNLSNTIIGNSGNNTLDGSAGADVLEGGAGDDLYIIDRVTDVVTEVSGQGTDTIQSIVTYTLPTNVENLTLVGLATISGTGNSDANIIVGNGAANTLNGAAGNDVLRGENGNDVLIGDAGNDTLIGGIGVDTLTGGADADTFMFESLTEMGTATRRDVITDFQTGVDKIDLWRLTSATLTSKGTSAFDAINQIRWSFYGTGASAYAVVQGNLSGDLLPEFEIKLNAVIALAANDFILSSEPIVPVQKNVPDIILDEYNGHTYLLSSSTTWEGAEAQAIAMGGHLVTINDAAENTWVANTFKGADRWIGLTDKATEGTFVWANGEVSNYWNWAYPAEPNNAGVNGEDYVFIISNEYQNWNDMRNNVTQTDSADSFQGIIELNATNSTPDTLAPVFSKAIVSGKTLTLSYIDAHSLSVNAIPTTAFSVMSGGVVNPVTSVRVDALAKTVTLNLTNNVTPAQSATISYTDPTTGNDNNVIQDFAGNDALSFTAQNVKNNDTLDEYNGHTYLLSSSTTWEGAEAQAIAMGGHLVTINDAAENTWLANTFTTAQHWIGLTDKANEGTFVWANGETSSYRNWDPQEPNDYNDPSNYYSGQDYGVTNYNNLGFWDDESNNPTLTDSLGVRQGIIELNATNSTLDTISPVFSKATVSGKTLTLSYLDAHSLSSETIPTTAFSVMSGGVANPVTSVRVDVLAKIVTLNLANDITSGSISYTDLTTGNDNNVIQDSAGNDALSFSKQITHQTMSGELTTTDARIESGAGAYFDSYPITGFTNGSTMNIALNSSSFDAYIQVIREGMGVVAYTNDGGDGTNALLNYTYQTGDTIYATAGYNYNGSLPPTGAYALTIIAI
jgi:serralysin